MTAPSGYHDQARSCLGCCLCQTVCPVFRELQREPASPRGKVHLVRELMEGRLEYSRRLKELMDLCLDCRQCVEVCPARISINELVLYVRGEFVKRQVIPWTRGWLLRGVLGPHGFSLGILMRLLALARQKSLGRLCGAGGERLLGLLPPDFSGSSLRKLLAGRRFAPGTRGQVGFFIGCLTDYLYPDSGLRAVRVLEKIGYRVVVPLDVACCGAPHLFVGDVEAAYRLALRNLEAFSGVTALKAVVSDCASCVAALKLYPEVFRGRSRYEQLVAFAAKVRDIVEFLAEESDLEILSSDSVPVGQTTVTLHDPCHQVRCGVGREAPRRLLRARLGINLVEMAEADHCCGGGGAFSLTHPELSGRILERKIANIVASGAEVVATGCPACRLQIGYGLRLRRLPIRVVHVVDLLEA